MVTPDKMAYIPGGAFTVGSKKGYKEEMPLKYTGTVLVYF